MVDLYTYDTIIVTPLLDECIEHLLSIKVKKTVSNSLIAELEVWKNSEIGVDIKSNVTLGEVNAEKLMPFSLVRRIQEQMKITPKDDQVPCLCDLLKGSRIMLPAYSPPPRNPDLVARLERIKVDLENKEYNKMIGKLSQKPSVLQDIKIDTQATNRQLWMVFNFLLTVIGSFVFGYFAALYAGYELLWCYMTGLIFGVTVFFADLYFIVKNL